jgi:hypothetical protein
MLEGDEARDLHLQWLGSGILLLAIAVLAIFFPLIAVFTGGFVLLWIGSYEASAAA